MCDTIVALGNSTASGGTLFAKNSDRDPNEAQLIELHSAQDFLLPAKVRCTYLEIPQVAHTYQVLLSRPFWIWGAEMGANEHGLVIGNEAIFTRIPHEKQAGLIGMDLLRLALERCQTAREAITLITGFIAEYGQAGNCGFVNKFQYDNGFLIIDPQEAWVLETAGREWAAERVKTVRSISNAISIGSDFDLVSDGLIRQAVQKGWCKSDADFHFARCYSDFLYTTASDGRKRHACTSDLLMKHSGQLTVEHMIHFLQSHVGDDRPGWSPSGPVAGADVCMHVGYGPIRLNQTTASMVTSFSPTGQIHWMTGTSAPCLSVFKPIWMDAGLPDLGPQASGVYTPGSLWWQGEDLHRAVMQDYAARRAAFSVERDSLQARFLAGAAGLADVDPSARLAYTSDCFSRSRESIRTWTERVKALPVQHQPNLFYRSSWKKIDRDADRAK